MRYSPVGLQLECDIIAYHEMYGFPRRDPTVSVCVPSAVTMEHGDPETHNTYP